LVVSSSRSLIDFLTAADFMLKNSDQTVNLNDSDTLYVSIQKIMHHVQQGFSDIIILC
jgi:hypothetical protein